MCTYYNCLPEDKPSGSKHVRVEDIVKIKLILTEVDFIGLRYMIVSQCMVQMT